MKKYDYETLKQLFKKREQEYTEAQTKLAILEGKSQTQIEEFMQVYMQIPEAIKVQYNLDLSKTIQDMSLEEIVDFKSKVEDAYKNEYIKIMKYLNQGFGEENTSVPVSTGIEDILGG